MKKVLQCEIEPGTSSIYMHINKQLCLWHVGGLSNISQTNYYLTPM